jgi:hypothetical protein
MKTRRDLRSLGVVVWIVAQVLFLKLTAPFVAAVAGPEAVVNRARYLLGRLDDETERAGQS